MKLSKQLIIIAFLAMLFVVGCTQTPQPKGDGMGSGQQLNMTTEEKDALTAQRVALALAACEDKQEGDACVTETPRGTIDATCTTVEEGLVCGQVGSGTRNIE